MQSKQFSEDWVLVVILIFGAILSSCTEIHMLNNAMKYYDHIEVQPIFQTAVMIIWILTGMIVLRETAFYTQKQLICITISIGLCCAGIYALFSKTK